MSSSFSNSFSAVFRSSRTTTYSQATRPAKKVGWNRIKALEKTDTSLVSYSRLFPCSSTRKLIRNQKSRGRKEPDYLSSRDRPLSESNKEWQHVRGRLWNHIGKPLWLFQLSLRPKYVLCSLTMVSNRKVCDALWTMLKDRFFVREVRRFCFNNKRWRFERGS